MLVDAAIVKLHRPHAEIILDDSASISNKIRHLFYAEAWYIEAAKTVVNFMSGRETNAHKCHQASHDKSLTSKPIIV